MNGKEPEISVVVVAYNHGKYIAEAIRSVLDQTFDEFELVVFDDGSSDDTKDVVGAFSDGRIRYYNQTNSGLPARGRNAGIGLAKGRYIAILDADDVWHKDKLRACKDALDYMPDVGLVCHNEEIIYNGRSMRVTSYGPYETDMYSRLLFKGNCLHTSAVMFRREIFFDDGMKFCEDPGLFAIEDYEYWLRLSKRYKFYFLRDVLGSYRVTEEGAFLNSAEKNSLNMIALLRKSFKELGLKDRRSVALMKKRLASVMCAAGRAQQHKTNYKESIKWYIGSLKEYPFHGKALAGLVSSLFRVRVVYK